MDGSNNKIYKSRRRGLIYWRRVYLWSFRVYIWTGPGPSPPPPPAAAAWAINNDSPALHHQPLLLLLLVDRDADSSSWSSARNWGNDGCPPPSKWNQRDRMSLLYGQVLARRAVSAAMPRYPHYEWLPCRLRQEDGQSHHHWWSV